MRTPVLCRTAIAACAAAVALVSSHASAADPLLTAPHHPPAPPAGSLGYPSRDPNLDALPGFRNPPPGYGEVPFWWWTGDRLDRDRLLWQIEELHKKGISGVQVNYAHEDTPGWPTYAADPPIFSDAWWEMWKFVAGECGKRDMGIGLSGYTLDWPNGRSLVSRTIYSDPLITGRELKVLSRTPATGGTLFKLELPAETVGVWAYPLKGTNVQSAGVNLGPVKGTLEWTPPTGDWQVWVYGSEMKPGSLNPMHPESGKRVIAQFFQRFQDNAPEQSSKGLNYFFHDELQFGVGDWIWTEDLPEQFRARKGYDLFQALPALFADIGPTTPKARMDYMDVRMQLIQERYFIPIFQWHWSRGMIYGCDQGSRGRDPGEFGNYFSAVRWYTSPGHDTPGGHADLIKGKVSSSISQLYQRPRVWLEGYHSLGWGAAPERLMQATCENYIYGCNLLNLHGLYYTTHGSFWEWAPPCYHFRMPYWDHMGVFLKYFERLSYVMSQGTHVADIAVLYPVTPGQAGMNGHEAAETAFQAGAKLHETGRDFIYIDDDSIQAAEIRDGALRVSGGSYRALVLPAMRAIRWSTLQKVVEFKRAGGLVIALGALPEASDRVGREDSILNAVVHNLFDSGAAPVADLPKLLGDISLDVLSVKPVQAAHRKVGFRDVYLVLGAGRGQECDFRSVGRVEWWDPWTGEAQPIYSATRQGERTRVRMPLTETEAQLIVFAPGEPEVAVAATDLETVTSAGLKDGRVTVTGYTDTAGPKSATVNVAGATKTLVGRADVVTTLPLSGDWEFELKPTMDNRWGDFRLPVAEQMIGAEARVFRYAPERRGSSGWESPGLDDSRWARTDAGFGPKFWKLGPLPSGEAAAALVTKLATARVLDTDKPVVLAGTHFNWTPYEFSWRWGKKGDPGHQGWHGLKENVSDDFIRLGKPREGHNELVYEPEPAGTEYLLWTAAYVSEPTRARVYVGGLVPTAIYLNGKDVTSESTIDLRAGSNPLVIRYRSAGVGHLVLQKEGAGEISSRTPLAMKWFDMPGIIPFEPQPEKAEPAGWYRFVAPPGLRAMRLVAYGQVTAWVDGKPARVSPDNLSTPERGARAFRLEPAGPIPARSVVALRIARDPGAEGGSALPEPVRLECGPGTAPAGDWSKGSALEHYSGGAWYRRTLTLSAEQAGGRVLLDLGNVVATAEVRVNGEAAGTRVAPPWVVDLTGKVRAGENRLEVLVYNTLANHYLNSPTKYQGNPRSGLIGPVQVRIQPKVTLTEKQ